MARKPKAEPETTTEKPDKKPDERTAKRAALALSWLAAEFTYVVVRQRGNLYMIAAARTVADGEGQRIDLQLIAQTETQLARWWANACDLMGDGIAKDDAMRQTWPTRDEQSTESA